MAKDILKMKWLVLTIGLIVGAAVIGQPIIKEYVSCQVTCDLGKKEEQTSANDQKDSDVEQISVLEAVAPISQVLNIATDFFVLDVFYFASETDQKVEKTFSETLTLKFFKVLFNTLIAPNAP